MIKNVTPSVLEEITQGILLNKDVPVKIKRVSIHSKDVKAGDLFIAIKGERFDGHSFLKEAVELGAVMVVVSDKKLFSHFKKSFLSFFKKIVPILYVKDSVKALGLIASYHRQQFSIPIIAITGTAGKTTTKDMLAAVLKKQYRVLKNEGTQNNFIGVPLTLLKIKASHQVVIVECGTNRKGDIEWLTYIVKPQIAILTNIGEGHLALLKNSFYVFQEKYHLVKGMAPSGKVIYNQDDPYLQKISSYKHEQSCITYGINHKSDYQASDIKRLNSTNMSFKLNRFHLLNLKASALSQVYNALAVTSCARLFKVPFVQIKKVIGTYRSTSGRLDIKKYKSLYLIDDSYNANPVSVRNALTALDAFEIKGRRIVICGDMLELGTQSQKLHSDIGKFLGKLKIDYVLSYGNQSRFITQYIQRHQSNISAFHFKERKLLHQKLGEILNPHDAVLVKGSRSMGMENTVKFIRDAII